ncbi:MAG: sigma-70 family RNA polymerase sigma factor [Inquilinus sp.]|uniref:sigma-70 family RNA polymerase sigma factor n=1 Tax=Inquilinus sp. TaxID=1932117 RepID=UPI003F392A9C
MLRDATLPEASFESLITPLLGDLRRFARSLTRNLTDTDDLLQETLLRAYRKFHLWEPGTNMMAWLVVMMRRIFFGSVGSVHGRVNNARIEECNGVVEPDQDLVIELRDVTRGISKLSWDHQQMIQVVAANEMAHDEAAEHFDVPVGTLRSRLGRARNQLKSLSWSLNGCDPSRGSR